VPEGVEELGLSRGMNVEVDSHAMRLMPSSANNASVPRCSSAPETSVTRPSSTSFTRSPISASHAAATALESSSTSGMAYSL